MNQHSKSLHFVIPGDINTLTGGYRYDKRVIEGLQELGWTVQLISLLGNYPFPTASQRAATAAQLAQIPDDSLVVFDGLAFSVLPEELELHSKRLRFTALVHHPLALETGLDFSQRETLFSLEKQALAHADCVITTSPSTASSLTDYTVPENRISVVCPGTDKSPLASGSTNDTPNLLCVATLTERKGHSVLLDALKQIENKAWNLTCVGSTERDIKTFNALEKQRKALALEERVSFAGELADEMLDTQYRQSDLFVLCSYHEGYGMVLTEAIAYGLPIVATRGGAMADTVPKGAGLLVEPGDSQALANALQRFLEDSSVRASLVQHAHEARSTLRSWHETALEFESALKP